MDVSLEANRLMRETIQREQPEVWADHQELKAWRKRASAVLRQVWETEGRWIMVTHRSETGWTTIADGRPGAWWEDHHVTRWVDRKQPERFVVDSLEVDIAAIIDCK